MARLLIVDDDPDILRIAEKILTQAGHEIHVADNALKAFDLLNLQSFDLLVSDANMPVYSGFELVKAVRANPKNQGMAVAMLTGLRERKDVEKAVKAGVDDYIIKPLDPLLLLQKISSLLDGRQPEHKPEIRFHLESNNQALITFETHMESISELGVVICTSIPMRTGQTVDLTAEFFSQWGDKVPPLKVLNIQPMEKPEWNRVELVFLGAPESFLQKIRRWIFTHAGSNRSAA